MSNIYKNAIDIYKQDAEHYRLKYIDALHTISLRDEEIEKLNADNKRLYQEHKECRDALEEQVGDLMIDKDRLVEQVDSNSHNNSSTHTHTIKREIDDYMHHNPNCKGVRLFILPRDEFNDGEYDNTIYWDDGIE